MTLPGAVLSARTTTTSSPWRKIIFPVPAVEYYTESGFVSGS